MLNLWFHVILLPNLMPKYFLAFFHSTVCRSTESLGGSLVIFLAFHVVPSEVDNAFLVPDKGNQGYINDSLIINRILKVNLEYATLFYNKPDQLQDNALSPAVFTFFS